MTREEALKMGINPEPILTARDALVNHLESSTPLGDAMPREMLIMLIQQSGMLQGPPGSETRKLWDAFMKATDATYAAYTMMNDPKLN